MDEQPGIVFRDGPTGRRAVLVGGPDVREVIRAVRSARAAEPDLDEPSVAALVAANTGAPPRLIDAALRYSMSCPDEIHAWIALTEELEAQSTSSS